MFMWRKNKDGELDRSTLNRPDEFDDDLSTTKCKLCRMVVHGWQKMEIDYNVSASTTSILSRRLPR